MHDVVVVLREPRHVVQVPWRVRELVERPLVGQPVQWLDPMEVPRLVALQLPRPRLVPFPEPAPLLPTWTPKPLPKKWP